MKRAAVLAFTGTGAILGLRIRESLASGWNVTVFVPERIRQQADREMDLEVLQPDGRSWVKENWKSYQGFIFVSATGIAVRFIAPCLADKLTDPAVVVVDERAGFAISLLSGHVGGANELTWELAQCLGATPVITTATDVEGIFAADVFARKNGLRIGNRSRIKEISGALLEKKPVGFFCEYNVEGKLPKGLYSVTQREKLEEYEYGIMIARNDRTVCSLCKEEKHHILHLIPRDLVLGIGCRRGTSAERILEAVRDGLQRLGMEEARLGALASIDIKAEEAGLLMAAERLGVSFCTYSAERLREVQEVSRESEFVRSVAGVGNVCERAAYVCAQEKSNFKEVKKIEMLLPKTIYDGVTLAAARTEWGIYFE
ncbi:MAG TPA: cobalamin biosynthesis protein CbiG [Lachnospiraceae bacterium]|nr:cobalamin biosynthesis protein CbiG [Lachnospiraceae bacterium]